MGLDISILGEQFILDYTGACYWKNKNIVLLADVHLGKSAHFRKHGMAVPSTADNLEFKKLDQIIAKYNPSNLLFLGDLFHSYRNNEWFVFEEWIRSQSIEVGLILGNHDLIAADHFHNIGVKTFESLIVDSFLLTHHPTEQKDVFNIAGHIHPAVKMKGRGLQKVNLPCFHRSKTGLVLPAFGDFTGTHNIKPQKGDQVYICADNQVIKVN